MLGLDILSATTPNFDASDTQHDTFEPEPARLPLFLDGIPVCKGYRELEDGN